MSMKSKTIAASVVLGFVTLAGAAYAAPIQVQVPSTPQASPQAGEATLEKAFFFGRRGYRNRGFGFRRFGFRGNGRRGHW